MTRSAVVAFLLLVPSLAGMCLAQSPAAPAPAAAPKPAPQPEKPRLYDEQADAKQQIAEALKRARKNNRRVLIQWGGNWCGWCVKLHELCSRDPEIKKKLRYEYDVVHIDSAGPTRKNIDLARSYGAELPEKGFPYLTFLDSSGKAIANQESGSLERTPKEGSEVVMGHDPAVVLELLTRHQAPYEAASKVLDDGLAAAKKDGKLVFLHFGAPWCGWCHRLEDWMDRPEVSSILSRQFVDVKIDIDRTMGGKELMARYAGGEVGIPWFAFVTPDGKAAADSFDSAKSNVGFPAKADEMAHFESMLKTAAKALSEADVKSLVESLRTDKPKGRSAGH